LHDLLRRRHRCVSWFELLRPVASSCLGDIGRRLRLGDRCVLLSRHGLLRLRRLYQYWLRHLRRQRSWRSKARQLRWDGRRVLRRPLCLEIYRQRSCDLVQSRTPLLQCNRSLYNLIRSRRYNSVFRARILRDLHGLRCWGRLEQAKQCALVDTTRSWPSAKAGRRLHWLLSSLESIQQLD
jgi:hypothetical protein